MVKRHRREDGGAEGCGEGVSPTPLGKGYGERAVPPLQIFFLLALKMVSFGAFWVVFLQLICLFTAYANIMPVCVTDSDETNE